jgi:hypothetical protein
MTHTKNILLGATFSFISATSVFAETLAPVVLEQDSGYTQPSMETQAWAVLYSQDEEGQIVQTLSSVEDAQTQPGTVVLYEMTIINPTNEDLTNIVMDSEFPDEILLQDNSFSGPENFSVDYTAQVTSDDIVYYPLYPVSEDVVDATVPSTQDIETLRVTVPVVPANTKILVTYAGKIRQELATQPQLNSN